MLRSSIRSRRTRRSRTSSTWCSCLQLLAVTTTLLLLNCPRSGTGSSTGFGFGAAVHAFNLVLMGARRGGAARKAGGLKRTLDEELETKGGAGGGKNERRNQRSLNRGRGQEITGVTLPAPGNLKGWEFGDGVRMACANVDGRYYAVQGQCPRCGFDLWKGDLIVDDPGFDDLPRVACPTCSTTYALGTGKYGPPFKRTGLQGFVSNMAKQATVGDATKDAKAFVITRDDDGRVYCRER